ncbi:MAG: CDP-alcohol phosphatidyltransferase family protein [Polyangiales bacterium]|nr:CDP-alcohol phosphatidyltransferase family protein [Myxococcales bacterium]MCB9658766.1 CDP-alcohol phosphatidyltransferase family protein [Sandaracinaceae bacterium]
MSAPIERFLPKPVLVETLEARLGRTIPLHPNILSALKVLVVTPLIAAGLLGGVEALRSTGAVLGLFLAFGALDALDGIVARARELDTDAGRLVDRLTDLPLLAVVAYTSYSVLPPALVGAKLGLDVLSLVLFAIKRRTTENRVRTTLTDATVLAMLLLSLGRLDTLVTPELVTALLAVNVGFTAIVVLFQLGLLKKRFIADALSAANALCGVASIYFASIGRMHTSLLLLLVGAAFDGLDGAAARKWGGTRFGVYSDDIADGINYAIAPGVALAYGVTGMEGVVVGVVYSVLTISRLVFFTLNKEGSDPNYFAGVPSTIGGLVALSSLILFPESPALVGLLVGVAGVLMVSFDAAYRHLGRVAFAVSRARASVALVAAVVLIGGGALLGPRIPAAIILVGSLAYGFLPQVTRFRVLIAARRANG